MNQLNERKLETVTCREAGNITGIIVCQDGVKVCEKYFHGFDAGDAVHIYSVTKSICSALIGIAVDKGHISSIDQKVLEFFPDHTVMQEDDAIHDVTIRHLLTMTVSYKFATEPYAEFFSSENWIGTALELLGGNQPNGEFRYSPIIGAHLLAGILVQATGRSVLDYAMEHLFTPLGIDGMDRVSFHSEEEQMAYYEKDKHSRSWAADPQGINTASWGLALTPADMAAVGQLYLDGGIRDGKQIISADWIAESTKGHVVWNDLSYGYLWWMIDEKEQIIAAMGDGGNVIYVNRKKKMVVAIAALFMPDVVDRIDFIRDHIEPLFEVE